ncbi:hypothetical protein SNE40_009603 [Patella caerulea]|uniref:Reverse transcriptase domain-containing protein n=1 Tax=Patella caerulea TaxID=87958 RepID=A0AAN8JUG1_PATCE
MTLKEIVKESSKTTCSLDTIPSKFLVNNIDEFSPVITNIIHSAISENCFPDVFKHAIVFSFNQKAQLVSHISDHDLLEKFQSAYRKYHSTETALIRVHNDINLSVDKSECVLLVLLDLSAAFDTVDHLILLN